MKILAGDAGGTKTRLALYERTNVQGRQSFECRVESDYDSTSASSLETIVWDFLERNNSADRIKAACIGVPGPIVYGTVRATNLPWHIEEKSLAKSLGISVFRLVNDHVATAAAIPLLGPDDTEVLHPGLEDREKRVFALLAPGTGLGQAYLCLDEYGRHHSFPSEGGHVEFAPRDVLEFELLTYLLDKFRSRVSIERVLSGPGLVNIYSFLRDRSYCEEPESLRQEVSASRHPAAIISAYGMEGRYPLCVRSLDIFAGLLGSRAGDVVLTYLSTGGLYLGGGIPPKLITKLREGDTVAAYLCKGRLSPLVESTPLRVILNERAALLGAASIAARQQGEG
ncbi:MAG: glucokinase [Deltaproteobacteria bacterium]|nr:glucokinase [Deltaproteobacteria bacterium]